MNENHALLAIVGSVIAVGLIGMFLTSGTDKITGYSPTDTSGDITVTFGEEVTIQFVPGSNSITFDISGVNFITGESITFNSEGNCQNVDSGEVCGTFTSVGDLIFEVGGNVDTQVNVQGSTNTPLAAGSDWESKVTEVPGAYDPLTPECFAQLVYTTLVTDPTLAIHWTQPGRQYEVNLQFTFIASTFGASTAVNTITVVGEPSAGPPPGCMADGGAA